MCFCGSYMHGQGHLTGGGIVGIFSRPLFLFSQSCTPYLHLLCMTQMNASLGTFKLLLFSSMCCILSSSSAPALLQSWQERVHIATANSEVQ